MQRVEERVSDGRILALLRSWLKQDIMPRHGAMDAGCGALRKEQ